MKKIRLFFSVLILILLSGCTEVNADYLNLELNPGIDTIELGTAHTDAGAQASYGLRVLDVTVVSNNVDVHQVGTYEIIYQATYSGITKYIRRIVDVLDQTAPVLTLNPGVDTIIVGQTWMDAGITVEDASDIESIIISGTVFNTEGDYTVTYQVTDIYGNQALIFRIVSVIDPS